MANDASKVYTGAPKSTGAIFFAPLGTALPTDASAALDAAFLCAGYVSEDGLVNKIDRKSDDITAWGGVVVASPQTGYSETFEATFIETNTTTLKQTFGADNVTVTADGIAEIHNSDELPPVTMIIELALSATTKKRIVIPNAKVTAIGDIKYVSKEAVGYGLTYTANPDASGNNAYGYLATTAV